MEAGLLAGILEGVGAHLESALGAVQLEGMRVAEAFARVMGQPLAFEELNGKREEDEDAELEGRAPPVSSSKGKDMDSTPVPGSSCQPGRAARSFD